MKLQLNNTFKGNSKNFPVVKLDEAKIPLEVSKLEKHLKSRIIGQNRAIGQFVKAYETFITGMHRPDGPIGVLLFLGPTGVGKSRVVEVFSEYLWGSPEALIKIDCGEFQHSHEISKLIGAPPGYLGHADVDPILSEKRIKKYWNVGPKFTPVLFDEIEKAHPSFHRILLGINGAGTLRTGKNDVVDMKPTLIIMTSNLGSRSIAAKLAGKTYGFGNGNKTQEDRDQDIYKACKDSVKSFFDSEFVNRIDRMVAFRPLTDEHFREILNIEIGLIQDRIIKSKKFVILDVSTRAKELFLSDGISKEFGARELRRTIERYLVTKLTRAFSTGQAVDGDLVLADSENSKDLDITIMKGVVDIPRTETPAIANSENSWIRPDSPLPFESHFKVGRCGRCGMVWNVNHQCDDISKLNRMSEAIKKPSFTSKDFWKRNIPGPIKNV